MVLKLEMWMVVLGAAVAAVAILTGALLLMKRSQKRETRRLEGKFGSEYAAVVGGAGRKKGEADLEKREQRVESFDLKPLAPAEAARLAGLWTATQARFVDDPGGAVSDADRLLGEAMRARGYPVADFEQRVADISVNHPEFVVNYRAAQAQAKRHSRGESSTEDLRQAMVHYRWLFTDIVGGGTPSELEAVPA